jgi:dTDP-4-amino-4,6-dideoxygalactose transaminase
MPFYRDNYGIDQGAFPHAAHYYAGAISLPLFPAMVAADVTRVVGELQRLLDS